MPRFAANLTMMFTDLGFEARFAAAAKAGFSAVECLFPYALKPENFAGLLKENKLIQALFNLPPGDWDKGERGLAALPGREAEFAASLEMALAYAKPAGVKRLHLMAGIARRDDQAAMARYVAAIRAAAAFLAPHGIEVLIEPLNARDMPGYLLDDFDRAAALIRDLALPNVKLQFDIYHCQILHGDVATRLATMLPIIGHVQVASVPLRNEPGTGELNDEFLFAELDRLGYQGFVGAEYRPRAGTETGLGWFIRHQARLGDEV